MPFDLAEPDAGSPADRLSRQQQSIVDLHAAGGMAADAVERLIAVLRDPCRPPSADRDAIDAATQAAARWRAVAAATWPQESL
jgi:hypothetical protein